MSFNHHLDFLASAAMMSGQFAEVSRAADTLVANAPPALARIPMLEPFVAKKLYVLMRFGRWDGCARDVVRTFRSALPAGLPAPNDDRSSVIRQAAA